MFKLVRRMIAIFISLSPSLSIAWYRLMSDFLSLMQELVGQIYCLPDSDDSFSEKSPTPILDLIENPIHLKNLSLKVSFQH